MAIEKGMILFGMKDTGGANALIPVAAEASKMTASILYCDGVSFERLNGSYPVISSKFGPEQALDWLKPNVVITSTCSPEENATVPVKFVKVARSRNIPVVAVQDFWGSGLSVKWDIWPDKICVQDELAKALLISCWNGFKEENVVVTGQPAFDHLSQVDCGSARANLRAKLGLNEDWPIIHLSGGFKGTAEAVSWTVNALNMLEQPVYLLIRYHPRMTRLEAPTDWKDIYDKCKHLPPTLKRGQTIDSSSLSSGEVNAGADIIIGNYSTLLVEGCYLRKDCISVITPEAKAYFEMECGNTLSEFPPSVLNACYSAISERKLMDILSHILRNRNFCLIHQQLHFVSDGNSVVRVLDVAYSML